MIGSRKKKIFLILIGLLIVGCVEAGLRIFISQKAEYTEDPFVGFQKIYKLFSKTDVSGKLVYTTNKNKRTFFNIQSFPLKKSPDTVRIFCFGGSSTYGRPYSAPTSFPRWLKQRLTLNDPSKKYEVINAGGISYASYRIAHLVEEALEYEPDIFILYSGHNEFLEERTYRDIKSRSPVLTKIQLLLNKSSLYRFIRKKVIKAKDVSKTKKKEKSILSTEVDAILDKKDGLELYQVDKEKREKTIEHYRYNLEKIARLSKDAGVTVLFLTVPANEKDFSPFKSDFNKGIIKSEKSRVTTAVFDSRKFLEKGEYKKAIELLNAALKVDPGYAESSYLMAKAYESLGQFEKAKRAYVKAKDNDSCPLRSLSEINDEIRGVANLLSIPLVDIEKSFIEKSPKGILGRNLFIDHCHPTVKGHQIIADEILAVLKKEGKIISSDKGSANAVAQLDNDIVSALTDDYFAIGEANIGRVLNWAKQYEESLAHLKVSIGKYPNNPLIHFFMANAYRELKLPDKAISEYIETIRLGPHIIDARKNLGVIYLEQKKYEKAEKEFNQVLSLFPKDKSMEENLKLAFYNQGVAFIKSAQYDKASEKFNQALTIDPSFFKASHNLAMSYTYQGIDFEKMGKLIEAEVMLKKASAVDNTIGITHNALGVVYEKMGRIEDTLRQFNISIEKDPKSSEPYFNLGLAYSKNGEFGKGVTFFNKAIELDPTNTEMFAAIGIDYYENKKFDKAISIFEKITKLNPKDSTAWYNIGLSYHLKGDYLKARKSYYRSLELNPANADLHFNLGLVLSQGKKYKDAIDHYAKAVELSPEIDKDSKVKRAIVRTLRARQ